MNKMVFKISEITAGMSLPEMKKLIKQENINAYAEVSGDKNPIHLDPEFGKKMQLGGTIAHGMIGLAYVSEFMLMNFGTGWLNGGEMNIRFKEPAKPNDLISISGKITNKETESNDIVVRCEIVSQNQKGQVIVTGDTKVRLEA